MSREEPMQSSENQSQNQNVSGTNGPSQTVENNTEIQGSNIIEHSNT